MSLPAWLLKRRPSPRAVDVVVVGAGVAGLVCGAALARAGLQIVVVDRGRRAGGLLQSFGVQGWSVDTGPLLWSGPELREALEFAGLENPPLAVVDVARQLRLAVLSDKGAEGPWPVPIPGAVPSPATLAAIKRILDIPRRAFADLGVLCETLRGEPPGRGVSLAGWLEGRQVDGAVLRGLAGTAEILGAPGRRGLQLEALEFAERLASLQGAAGRDLVVAGDGPIPGARGVVQGLVDALLAAGGELRLGTRVRAVLAEDGAASGVVVSRGDEPFVETIEAGACVLAVGSHHLSEVLPSRFFNELPEQPARIVWACGAFGLDGKESTPEDAGPGVSKRIGTAFLRALPLDENALDGRVVEASAFAPRVAPPGSELFLGRVRVGEGRPAEFQQAESGAVGVRALLEVACPGAGARLAWERLWVEAVAEVPLPGDADALPLALPGLARVFLASARTAGQGSEPVSRAATSGAAAARRLLGAG